MLYANLLLKSALFSPIIIDLETTSRSKIAEGDIVDAELVDNEMSDFIETVGVPTVCFMRTYSSSVHYCNQ